MKQRFSQRKAVGRVPPGDHEENTRDHERLWLEIARLWAGDFLRWGRNVDVRRRGLELDTDEDITVTTNDGVLSLVAGDLSMTPTLSLTASDDPTLAAALLQGGSVEVLADSYKTGGPSILIKTTAASVPGTSSGVISLQSVGSNLINITPGQIRLQTDLTLVRFLTAAGEFHIAGSTSAVLVSVDGTGKLDMHDHRIVNVGAPTSDGDAATKVFVEDTVAAGAPPIGPAGGALDGTYPNPGLAASVAGDGLAESGNVLAVNVDGSTIEISSDSLRVKDGGITPAKLSFDPATQTELDAHVNDASDAHDAGAISVADVGGYFADDDVEAVLQEIGAELAGGTEGMWEVVLSGSAPPEAVTNEAEDDWLYAFVAA